ncbi:LmbU [Solihabitans fulvus]|uniref:LmbU n=1 Tax=Solihabitans fulvus TaxID=1892852 RepID=A0A5B2WMV6_9PSEU|nr:LmbU [Solihabitans fulvus]
MTFDAWERAGHQISRVVNSSAWYLGDWLVFGQDKYANRYSRAVEEVGLDYQTLRNYAWIARRFEYSRRREGLSFQHHAEVASMASDEQDHWLDLAERHGWSRNRLRREVRESRAEERPEDRALLPRVSVAVVDVQRWRQAATEARVDFEEWVIAALNVAVDLPLSATL